MRALRNIHSALRPGGLLLDIHPEPSHPQFEALTDGQATPIGSLDFSSRFGSVFAGRAALQSVVDAHLFVRERETTFVFIYRFATFDIWLDHVATRWSDARIPVGVTEHAREALASGHGTLRVLREIHAARLRKPRE